MSKNHLAYLTANDDDSYIKDMLNFKNMAMFNPGVDQIDVYIAISAVRPFTDADTKKIGHLINIFKNCNWVRVQEVILKGNIGRDFSSAYVCLKEISKTADCLDIVMVKNRSGYGPLCDNWFEAYAAQLQKNPTTGLVGSTINFSGHPKKNQQDINTHVQTYVYMSYWKYFSAILNVFPAIRCTDRLNLIVEGEIGLSRMFMEKGFALSCLAWPDQTFTLSRPNNPLLPQNDVKRKTTKNLPILYKYRQYGRWCLYSKIKWLILMRISQDKDLHEELLEHTDAFT